MFLRTRTSRFMRITSRLYASRKCMQESRKEERRIRQRAASKREGRKNSREGPPEPAPDPGSVMSKASMQSADTRVEMFCMDARHLNRSPCFRKELNLGYRYVPIDHDNPTVCAMWRAMCVVDDGDLRLETASHGRYICYVPWMIELIPSQERDNFSSSENKDGEKEI